MQKTGIHCVELTCKFTIKASTKCLVEHMITAHNYKDIPCGKTDCSYISYSYVNFKRHQAKFHGHGMKPTEFGKYPCPFSSCNVFSRFPHDLKKHISVHENRLFSCSYCQYRNVDPNMLQEHLLVHFGLKVFDCDLCPRTFVSKKKLKTHKKIVHNTDDFICVDCGFVSPSLSSLSNHRASCKERLKFSRILWNKHLQF